jgi:phytoene dehydrogenase-like protein
LPNWARTCAGHGLEYVTAPLATGSSLPDGRTAVAPVDPEALAAELDRLGEAAGWNALFAAAGPHLPPLLGLLGAGLDGPEAEATLAGLLRDGRQGALPFGRLLAGSALDLVCGHFRTEELRSLAAPWPLHLGAGPEDAAGALWTVFVLAALAGGNPTPLGGSGRLADTLVGLVTERGGDVVCGIDVDEVLVRDGRAVGVRTTAGVTVDAREAVVVSATPDQLYGRLLRGAPRGSRGRAGPGWRLPLPAGLLPDQPRPVGAAALSGPQARRGRRTQPGPRRRRAGHLPRRPRQGEPEHRPGRPRRG